MKNLCFLVMVLIIALNFTGCSSKSNLKEINENSLIGVTIGDKLVKLDKIDANDDRLLDNNISNDTDFEMEKNIFSPLLQDVQTFSSNSELKIKLNNREDYDDIIIYDHLLNEDGCSYFNRSINKYDFKNKEDLNVILKNHPSKFLSSDSNFLIDGEERGFRVILKNKETITEYVFAVHLKNL
jgi:hypothetical protein